MSDIIYTGVLTKGLESSLASTAIENGKLRFTTDTRRLYLDLVDGTSSSRLQISDVEDSLTEEEILSILAPLPKIYVSTDTHRAFVNSDLTWYDLAAINLSVADIADIDLPLWFSAADAESPKYSTDITYNTSTKEMKTPNVVVSETATIGTMKITDTLVETHRAVDFFCIK